MLAMALGPRAAPLRASAQESSIAQRGCNDEASNDAREIVASDHPRPEPVRHVCLRLTLPSPTR
jgi:hypothetical protein